MMLAFPADFTLMAAMNPCPCEQLHALSPGRERNQQLDECGEYSSAGGERKRNPISRNRRNRPNLSTPFGLGSALLPLSLRR